MGYYEVVYYYHDRLADGKWNTDERKEMKKKIGGPNDEVDVDKVAAIIMMQLAKRDKLVVDVDVYEYAKKKINFKESKDGSGIVLKNKKFTVASMTGELVSEEVPEEAENGSVLHPHNTQIAQRSNSNNVRGNVKTWMLFDPELPLLHEVKQRGLKLTPGKKYPIYEMSPHPSGGHVLTILDDAGRNQTISDKYFVANTQIRLIGDDEVGGFDRSIRNSDARLSYDNQFNNVDMPNLRPNLGRMV